MGRGSSGANGGSSGGSATGELKLPDGSTIEFDGTLKFGKKDTALTGKARQEIENWENKRVKNKVEYAFAVDENGDAVGREIKGNKNSVRVPLGYHNTENGTFTHIHPRDSDGYLGGTFSGADLNNFANYRQRTVRAAAKEGTYSISKGKNFDAQGFKGYVARQEAKFDADISSVGKALRGKIRDGSLSYSEYGKQFVKAFNTGLVNLHNAYAAGQKKYGYTYTLERRG